LVEGEVTMAEIRRARPATSVAILLLLAACSGLQLTTAVTTVPADFEVTLERGPCFGSCPVYKLMVGADGQVVYEGIRFVEVEGTQIVMLGPGDVRDIAQAVVDATFFTLEDEYTVQATDLPSILLTVTMDGNTKQVYHYGVGCGTDLDTAPAQLCALEGMLEAIPMANGWVTEP
jgi:hypothetical protein